MRRAISIKLCLAGLFLLFCTNARAQEVCDENTDAGRFCVEFEGVSDQELRPAVKRWEDILKRIDTQSNVFDETMERINEWKDRIHNLLENIDCSRLKKAVELVELDIELENRESEPNQEKISLYTEVKEKLREEIEMECK